MATTTDVQGAILEEMQRILAEKRALTDVNRAEITLKLAQAYELLTRPLTSAARSVGS